MQYVGEEDVTLYIITFVSHILLEQLVIFIYDSKQHENLLC